METDQYYINLYTNLQLSLAIIALIVDVILFCSIISFRILNAEFHYSFLKHCCCINGCCLALLVLSQHLILHISYNIGIAFCTVTITIHVLYTTYYVILFLIAIDWILSIYNRKLSEKLRKRKDCLTITLYLFMVFVTCFSLRICVFAEDDENIVSLFALGVFLVLLVAILFVAVTHCIKCHQNIILKNYNSFPLKISLVSFLLWLLQSVYWLLIYLKIVEVNIHFYYFTTFIGMCTPIFIFFMCLTHDKLYRGCLKYIFGCKAYDELHHNNTLQMDGRQTI